MAEAFTSKNVINRLRTSKRIGNSSWKQNLKKSQKTLNSPESARWRSSQLLQVQRCWDFNNSIIEFQVSVSLALLCSCANTCCVQGVASARRRRASKRLDCKLWKRDLSHEHNRKEKIVMIFGDGVGASLVIDNSVSIED